jgi:hypothetical protein
MNKFQKHAQPNDDDQDSGPQISALAEDSGEVCRRG